jgi:hypothetical protein
MSIVVENSTSESVEPIPSDQVSTTEEVTATAEETVEVVDQPQESVEESTTAGSFEIPEKYAGKTLEDVIEMHQNIKSAYDRQSNEIGEQRRLITELMEAQSANQVQQPQQEVETYNFDDNFYDDPQNAINHAIENHPEILKAREANIKAARSASEAQLAAKHPDYLDIAKSEDFQNWVAKSKVRTNLFFDANEKYDFDAATELLDTWKSISMIDATQKVKKQQEKTREKAMKQTSSETRSSGDSVGGKKIYRREDLRQLQIREPDRYAALADEIYEAYAEGRVK